MLIICHCCNRSVFPVTVPVTHVTAHEKEIFTDTFLFLAVKYKSVTGVT
jgi:hypothetical protein